MQASLSVARFLSLSTPFHRHSNPSSFPLKGSKFKRSKYKKLWKQCWGAGRELLWETLLPLSRSPILPFIQSPSKAGTCGSHSHPMTTAILVPGISITLQMCWRCLRWRESGGRLLKASAFLSSPGPEHLLPFWEERKPAADGFFSEDKKLKEKKRKNGVEAWLFKPES